MKRRKFITLLGGAAASWPLAARAQQPAMPMIGFLSPGMPEPSGASVRSFRQGLMEVDYLEGRNVTIEYRWAGGASDRLPELAVDLVKQGVSAIVVTGGAAAMAAKAATTKTPIVFFVGVDPVKIGLVDSLNHPGGNLTGVTNLNVDLGQKRLELMHELVPSATTIALLINPSNASTRNISPELEVAAVALGLQISVVRASTENDFDAAFSDVTHLRAGALVIGADAFFNTRSEQLALMAVRYRVPAIYQFREFAAAGGLMSYGGNITDGYRVAGLYAGRILKGENPADLPVQQFSKIELIINLKTARALGLDVPPTLLARADEVIE